MPQLWNSHPWTPLYAHITPNKRTRPGTDNVYESICYVSYTFLCLCYRLANSILTRVSWDRFYYYSHFSDKGSNSENADNTQDQRAACEPGDLAHSPYYLSLLFLRPRSMTFPQHCLPGMLPVPSANTLCPVNSFSEILRKLHNFSPWE